MRMMLKARIPVGPGNAAIQDGTIEKVVKETMEVLRPEAAYFYPEGGQRACLMVFDMAESAKIPTALEPLFIRVDASVELIPVMNAEELARGLQEFAQAK